MLWKQTWHLQAQSNCKHAVCPPRQCNMQGDCPNAGTRLLCSVEAMAHSFLVTAFLCLTF